MGWTSLKILLESPGLIFIKSDKSMRVSATTLLRSCFGASDINLYFEFHLVYIKMLFLNTCTSASPFQFPSLDITIKTSSALTAGAALLI